MKEEVAGLLKKVLKEMNVKTSDDEIIKLVSVPPSPEFGDYSFPCFSLAEKIKKSPNEIAGEIKAKLEKSKKKGIIEIKLVNGYVNFFLDRKEIAKKTIFEVLNQKDSFGSENLGAGEKILIEHTSINPNASPHLGRARNALIGDFIVRISRFLGFNPEVHYYVNDISKQIAMLVLANAHGLAFKKLLSKYIEISKKIEKNKELEKKVFEILKKFEVGDKETVKKFNKITKTAVLGQKKILSGLGINYDYFDYESSYLKKSKEILGLLEKTGKLRKDNEGRLYLDQSDTELRNMMESAVLVLTRSDGTGLYPLRDLAYTIEKIKKAKKNIIVLGEDQKLYFAQLKEALKLLGFNAPQAVHYSFILLNSKGKTRKMSTRKGDVVLLEDFLNLATKKAKGKKEIAISAIKYSILKNNNNKVVNFNLDESLKFEGDTGPYLLYSYARASSIIRKAKAKISEKPKLDIKNLEEKEIELIKKISLFKEIVLNSYRTLNPSLIANYSYQLAQLFNEFYHSCRVVGSEQQNFRLALVQSFRQTLKNSLSLLGINVVERM